jgi:hypothetical protein
MNYDESNPEFLAIKKAIFEQAIVLANMEGFTARTMQRLQELCDDATKKARQHNVGFPDCVVTYFYPSHVVRIYDREADHKTIQRYIVTLARQMISGECPKMSMNELAAGFRRAFPNYKPMVEEMNDIVNRQKQKGKTQ